jgi:hypothetical protein
MKTIFCLLVLLGLSGYGAAAGRRALAEEDPSASLRHGLFHEAAEPADALLDDHPDIGPLVNVTRVLSAGDLKETTARVESMRRLAEALKQMAEAKQR